MRLFTAVLLPTALRRATADAATRLFRDIPYVRAVSEDNLHVTVRFLGEVRETDLGDVEIVLRAAAGSVAAGHAALEPRWGAFPKPARPSVVFRAVHDPRSVLTALAAAVSTALAPLADRYGPAFAPEKRVFTPHVTVARMRSPHAGRRVAEALLGSTWGPAPADGSRTENGSGMGDGKAHGAAQVRVHSVPGETPVFEVRELALVESVLEPGGPRYAVRDVFPLSTPGRPFSSTDSDSPLERGVS